MASASPSSVVVIRSGRWIERSSPTIARVAPPDLRDKAFDIVTLRPVDRGREKGTTDAEVLPRIGDRDGYLDLARGSRLEAQVSDDPFVPFVGDGDQALTVGVVRSTELASRPIADAPRGAMEPGVQRVG